MLVAMFLLPTAGPARALIQFPGPTRIELSSEALSAATFELVIGDPDYIISGSSDGFLSLHQLTGAGERFLLLTRFSLAGKPVHMMPWEGRPLLDQGLVVATANPDRLVFLGVGPSAPFFTIEDVVDLEEDPGTFSFVGDPIGGSGELAVSLPGIDKVAFLAQQDGSWGITSVQDTGDQPFSVQGLDVDGDQMRELVVANRGPLSGVLGFFKRDQTGTYARTQLEFPAGTPSRLDAYDLDGDGRRELAVTVAGKPEIVIMRSEAGALVPMGSIGLTLPADAIHLTAIFDGTTGLLAANQDRGLVDFFQYAEGVWTRLNSYYPGVHPLALLSGEFNGDSGRDLVSIGGDANEVTVMFANPQPGFWGLPALALTASPGASVIADFDGDGWRDLAVSNGNEKRLSFFPGLANGGFGITPVDFPLTFYPGQVAALDTDDDPASELAVLDGTNGQVFVVDHVPGPGFVLASGTPTGLSPTFVVAHDMDQDGRQDLLIITREEEEVRVLFGGGGHSFPAMISLGLDNGADWVSALDLNADGLLDLALSDGFNRVWTTTNTGGRSFDNLAWLNAGSGPGIMAVGDLDQDLDEDLVVVNKSDESLTMYENTGSGKLTRRIGGLALTSSPTGILIRDMDLDGLPEIVLNLREERVLGVNYGRGNWEYSTTAVYDGGPDVTEFKVGQFNLDEKPDILTLDRSLMLGLTLLNVEQDLVSVRPEALSVGCGSGVLEIRIQPDRPGPWKVDVGRDGRWESLAESGQALVGSMDYDRGTWILTVDFAELPRDLRQSVLRLSVGQGSDREWLDHPLAEVCPDDREEDLPLVAWARLPWPNPFNPLVNARFALNRPARVSVGVYDLSGRRVAQLAHGMYEAGDHAVRWDGKSGDRNAAAGVYLLRISTPDMTLHHKVMLLK